MGAMMRSSRRWREQLRAGDSGNADNPWRTSPLISIVVSIHAEMPDASGGADVASYAFPEAGTW
jgi:hypothetical protein